MRKKYFFQSYFIAEHWDFFLGTGRSGFHELQQLHKQLKSMAMNEARPDIFAGVYKNIYTSTANKYYPSAGHHEKKNKKTTGQKFFLVVTIKQ